MLKASPSMITRLSADEGVVFPILQPLPNREKDTLKYEGNTMGSRPTRRDPYEEKWVEVKRSLQDENAGEGLFCKKSLKKGQVAAYFNGIKRTKEEVDQRQFDINRDYSISFQDCLLDIPEEFRHTDKYRASLGHKVRIPCIMHSLYLCLNE